MIINRNLPPVGYSQQAISGQSYNINNPPIYGNDGIPTKGMSSTSDADYRTAIENMAKRHFAAGYNLSQAYHSSELQNLMNSYSSVSSPDRRGIINNTLSGLSGKLQSMMPRFSMNRFCILDMLMQKSNLFPNNRNMGNNFINFTDSAGNIIAMYSQLPNGGMGWSHVPTKGEIARGNEFARLYNEAFQNAQGELSANVYNGNVQAQTEALNEYARLAAEVKVNASPENIAAKNAARAAFEAATHRLVNVDIVGNKAITTTRKADADSIIAALERVAPGSTQQEQSFNLQV